MFETNEKMHISHFGIFRYFFSCIFLLILVEHDNLSSFGLKSIFIGKNFRSENQFL
jgi:hypothetical protein